MAASHNRELCDAGARWELKLLAVLLLIIALVFLPPKYDPAIRIKEWLDDR
jgi:hypothetical protein